MRGGDTLHWMVDIGYFIAEIDGSEKLYAYACFSGEPFWNYTVKIQKFDLANENQ